MDFAFVFYILELFGIAVAAYYAYKCYGILLELKENAKNDKNNETDDKVGVDK